MGFDTYNALKIAVLGAAQEEDDGTSDWDTQAGDAIIEAFRLLVIIAPWLSLRKYPPGALALLAPITTLTVTATAGTTSATLSAAHATSLADYVFIPDGADYIIRITAHTAATDALTVDAVPETLAAKAGKIVKIEYDLASDCGILVDSCFWTLGGKRIPVVKEETLREKFPNTPQQAWPAQMAARVAKTKVRFSSFPGTRERVEYPYSYEPSDPSGATTLVLDEHLRPLLYHWAASILFELKREYESMKIEEARLATGLSRAEVYEHRLLVGLGGSPNGVRLAGYGN